MKVIYSGLFLTEESEEILHKRTRQKGSLKIEVLNPHVTFKFKPETLFPEELVGKTFDIEVIKYGNNGRVQGFEVKISKEIIEYYHNKNTPHITVSRIEEAKPAETGQIVFEEMERFTIKGKLGYFTNKGIIFSNN